MVLKSTRITEGERGEARHKIINLLRKEKNKPCTRSNLEKQLEEDLRKTKMFLKKNKELLVLEADKGRSTVIMDREEYREKLLKILQDKENYKKVGRNPTKSLEKKSKCLVDTLRNEKWIDERLADSLTRLDSVPPKIYGLPKIHKTDLPLRPVVSMVKAPTELLSKFVASILENIRNDEINLRSSTDLQLRLTELVLQDDDVMVSFDVIAMFPSIPVHLACALVMDRWPDIKIFAPMTKDKFKEILEFCLTSGYCMFEGHFYEQKNGLAIGSSLSPIVAEIVMDHIFNKLGESFNSQEVKFKTKYVDDSFAL